MCVPKYLQPGQKLWEASKLSNDYRANTSGQLKAKLPEYMQASHQKRSEASELSKLSNDYQANTAEQAID